MQQFKIVFYNERGETIGETMTAQESHWDACAYGWDHAPQGTDDFQVTAV